MEPPRSITVAPSHLLLTGLSRWLWKTPPEGIVLRWGDGHALYLRAPFASSVVPVLQTLVDQMRSACSGRALAAVAVEWVVSAPEVVQALCGRRAVARR